jgi:hypothetical protein
MSDSLKAASMAAGLTEAEKREVNALIKAVAVHKQLSNLPADVANKVYNSKPVSQQQSLAATFGTEDPVTKPEKGWLGTAWHYTGGALWNAGSKLMNGLQNVSDFSTRLYRTAAISTTQGMGLADAWDEANDKGDKVFNPGRIGEARARFGNSAVTIAMRIASGEAPEKIMASATPEEAKYVQLAYKKAGTQAEQDLFQDTLDAVNASKYSPGRQVANLLLPRQIEGSGLAYRLVSGVVDAAYRVFADPLIIGGKVANAYKVSKYSVDVLAGNFAKGGQKLQDYFASANGKAFWDNYGATLERYTTARKAGEAEAMRQANAELLRLAPEFGPAVIDDFLKADQPITNALTAQAYFENTENALKVIKGGLGRKRVVMPVLDAKRKARIAIATTANKVFDIDKMGPKFVEATYFGDATTTDGIKNTIINGKKTTVADVAAGDNPKEVARFSMAMIMRRIDRAKAKFAIAPLFRDDTMDVTSAEAPEQIYRLARLVMTKRDSQLLQQTFASIDDVGERKEIFYGLWSTIADIRGLNTTEPGQLIVRRLTGKGETKFQVGRFGDEFEDVGALPSDFNNFVSAPSLVDLDRAAARSTIIQKMLGTANKDWVDKMTGAWSFLTLAGPRYAIRNATEDLMVALAIGQVTPWGLAKSRYLSTRVNTAIGLRKGLTKGEKVVENPLGAVMRVVNKKEADKYAAEIAGLDDAIRNAKAEIKTLRDEIKTLDKNIDGSRISDIEERINVLRASTQGGLVQQTRNILARALEEGRVNKLRSKLGGNVLDDEELQFLAEQITYGNIDNTLSTVSEGAFNFVTGNDYISRAVNFQKATGVRLSALELNVPSNMYSRARGERGFKKIALGQQDEASMIAWLMRISYYGNDELGSIALANADQANAVDLVYDWIVKHPEFTKNARLAAQGIDEMQHAKIVVNRAKEIIAKRKADDTGNAVINSELLDKIRVFDDEKGQYVISGRLSLDDLPDNLDDIPEYVIGPTLVPVADAGSYTASIMTKGWTWLGLANSRLSREPLVINEMVKIRKQMKKSGFYDAYIGSFLKNIDPTDTKKVEAATNLAKRKLAEAVEERATSQILQYVDNPLVRSQIAFSSRNFARFYRATEDFYRRVYRVVRYNPEAIVKAGLTYEGITHSGWIQKDDQGEPYFVYPGIEPVYRAVQGALQAFGIGAEFKTPLPVQFGAQLKMITPSLNPDSLAPTFAGPLSGVSVKVVSNLVGIFNPGAADTITQLTLGKYAVDQPMVSAFLPAHINRLYSAMNQDERDSQYASAWRKAVTYLEAGGHGIPKRYDESGNLIPPSAQELEEYRLRVKNTTVAILGTRFVFGFFAPASPQVQLKSDMAEWVRDNGRANFKQVWNKLAEQYAGDYDAAMAKWVELYPDQIPFTVPESERSTVAYFKYAEESGAFVDQNQNLFKAFPQGAAFLIPHKAGFSWDAYKTMTDMGLRRNKRVSDYLRDVQTAADLQTYYAKKNAYEESLTQVGTDFERSQLRKEFTDWKTLFFAGRPLVAEELSQGSQKAIERINAINDLRNMLQAKPNVMPATEKALREMLDLYDTYKNERKSLDLIGGGTFLSQNLKDETIIKMRELSEFNENTKSAYNVLFASLLGD